MDFLEKIWLWIQLHAIELYEKVADIFTDFSFVGMLKQIYDWFLGWLKVEDYITSFSKLPDIGSMNAFDATKLVITCYGLILGTLLCYRAIYTIVGFFTTRKFPKAKQNHKYAILIPARNERDVLPNLLDSIHKQDYPADLVTTFVIADNCTDDTAKVARQHGAICYERFDDEHRTKGFALQFLLDRIEEDYGRQSFEGYFIFDADNLLKTDYITRMNESFDAGEKIITSYRNTKNFDENWIAASYALHWLRSIRINHRARSVFKLATNIQGTGFLFASELVKDGWKYTSLTEDRAFTADAVVQGYAISYNDAAEFYDEQPVNLRIMMRQRIRWAKGHILAFFESGWGLFKNIFKGKGFKQKFMSYDMLLFIAPKSLFSFFRNLIKAFVYAFVFYNVSKKATFLGFEFTGTGFLWCLLVAYSWRFATRLGSYLGSIWIAVYVFFFERKRIKKINFFKKIWYCITWPTFDLVGIWAMYIALFTKVTWKPIPHKSKVSIDEVKQGIEVGSKAK